MYLLIFLNQLVKFQQEIFDGFTTVQYTVRIFLLMKALKKLKLKGNLPCFIVTLMCKINNKETVTYLSFLNFVD